MLLICGMLGIGSVLVSLSMAFLQQIEHVIIAKDGSSVLLIVTFLRASGCVRNQ